MRKWYDEAADRGAGKWDDVRRGLGTWQLFVFSLMTHNHPSSCATKIYIPKATNLQYISITPSTRPTAQTGHYKNPRLAFLPYSPLNASNFTPTNIASSPTGLPSIPSTV